MREGIAVSGLFLAKSECPERIEMGITRKVAFALRKDGGGYTNLKYNQLLKSSIHPNLIHVPNYKLWISLYNVITFEGFLSLVWRQGPYWGGLTARKPLETYFSVGYSLGLISRKSRLGLRYSGFLASLACCSRWRTHSHLG